ncbi:DNA polymerase ligase N-terminal domain-containing protein [uncultured Jatrophihabitans sp.]|uniref:DNA polymerase ligase N-terminal domain-containing protein n=1 Tax=uncultured Jatrophihabitans sp. TaxID=1610747 RepID=UPI0035CC0EE6
MSPAFVIQHHLATADHYDFRLEIDGVLASWAVPKGPSTDPRVRRYAKRVGDHDLDYRDYEGVLSVQRRGGGIVQVWDRGTFDNVSKRKSTAISAAEALADGHLSFVLHGEKVRGGYSLIRTRGDDDAWLLIKKADAEADARRNPTSTENESVLTGRTLEQIEADGVE